MLVGHSQGSFVLAELIRQEIDGKPVQARLVSAMLLGATFTVPKGRDVGGTFKNIPVCKAPRRPAASSRSRRSARRFRRPPTRCSAGRRRPIRSPSARTPRRSAAAAASCTRTVGRRQDDRRPGPAEDAPWVTPEKPVETPYVSVPGLLTARCARTSMRRSSKSPSTATRPTRAPTTSAAISASRRTSRRTGACTSSTPISRSAICVDIVGQQTKAYFAKKSGARRQKLFGAGAFAAGCRGFACRVLPADARVLPALRGVTHAEPSALRPSALTPL